MRVVTVVGTRPEFIQVAPVSRMLRLRSHTEIMIHTGQHYDAGMSDVFFDDLHLPTPDYNLGVGAGTHGQQTSEILVRMESILRQETPDVVIVFGDTNSTVGAALAAAKLNIPVAHVEAGLRSFDRTMPEEINRVVTDHISATLFAPTTAAVTNLSNEGLTQGVYMVGDVRVDVLVGLVEQARTRLPALREAIGISSQSPFLLATIHRASNTDDPVMLRGIVQALNTLGVPVVLPVHPRLRKMLGQADLTFSGSVYPIDPLGYLDLIALLDACAAVITDSGGLQKEAYMLKRPTVTVRSATEWVETIEAGWNRLCLPNAESIHSAVADALRPPPALHPNFYGDYCVSERICDVLEHCSH